MDHNVVDLPLRCRTAPSEPGEAPLHGGEQRFGGADPLAVDYRLLRGAAGYANKMIKLLRSLGITSDVAYLASIASIGASIGAWTLSHTRENAPGDKADRWGIYVGLWAPTFMSLGNALKHEETH